MSKKQVKFKPNKQKRYRQIQGFAAIVFDFSVAKNTLRGGVWSVYKT